MHKVRFGVVREVVGDRDPSQIMRLREALSACFGPGIELIIADSYAALLQSFARAQIDAAWLTPAMVVEASRRGALGLVAGATRDGACDYHATLVVRDDGVKTVADLQGCRAGWVDPWSAAGYLYPRRMLRDAGLDPSTVFAKQKFYGSHPAVLNALADGSIDVAATYLDREGRLRRLSGIEVEGLRTLGRTASIPSDALCVRDSVPPEELALLTEHLVGERAVELAATLEAQGFVPRPLADYAMVRALLDDEWGRTSNEPPVTP